MTASVDYALGVGLSAWYVITMARKPTALLFALVLILSGCGESSSGDGGAGGTAGTGGSAGSSERRIFVTNTVQTAALGGIVGADALCATQAGGAGLGGNFKAWLSTISSSVADRLSHDGGPFVRVDGVIVADDWADLVDGALLASISLDAMGQPQAGDTWTGTLATGASYPNSDCAGFTSGSVDSALCGSITSTTLTWTENIVPACSSTLRLYCVEQ